MIQEKLTDFYSTSVRDFSVYACERSIPSGVDGFKPSQRKIIYGMVKLYPKDEVKVSIAGASIMAITAYHHGSLDDTLVKLAQNFPGSNNMPLLEGIGQFGSRISPAASAARYIFAKLTPVFNQMMVSEDADILEYCEDDSVLVEPTFYLPTLPLVLINGADGIGTGYATHICQYNPDDIKKRVIGRLNGVKATTPLVPWYNGFQGLVNRNSDGSVVIEGNIEVTNTSTLTISELPIGKFTIDYRNILNKLEADGTIKSYSDDSNETETKFVVKVSREFASQSIDELKRIFKLVSKDTENFTVWDENFRIRNFKSADELLNWFVDYRLTRYQDRKDSVLSKLNVQRLNMKEEIRFIAMYLAKSKAWATESTDTIIDILTEEKFNDPAKLLGLSIRRLTGTQIEKLKSDIKDIENSIDTLSKKTPKELYLEDLKALKL